MNEASDGVRDKSSDRKDESQSKDMGKEGGKSTSSLSENASRTPKMVENSGSKQPASDLKPSERYRSDRPSYDKRYESRERPPYGNVNGYKPSGRGRRDFDRRPPKTGKPYRGRGDFKGAGGAGSYRRDERRDPEAKRIYDNQDETRLSKLLKKLQRETERDRKLYTIKQLIDYIHTQEGAKLASRSMEEVLDNLKDVLGYKEVKAEVVYCIGLVGTLSGSDAQSYFNWIFGQITSLIEDDIKIMFLQALLEPLKCDEMQWTADFMEMLLGQLQSLLENADTPELLTAVVNVILQLTNTYPKVFQMFFRRDRVIEFTSRALVSFRQFWLADQEFTQELLGQFLEDMEAYVEDLGVVSQNADKLGPAPEEISKIGSLLRVFTTVVKSLGPTFDHSKSVELSLPYLIEVLKSVSAVYKTLLGLRSIALLEETYRHLLGDIEKSFNTLLEACGDEGLVRLVTSTPFQDVTYTAREAETVCMFNLWALGEIGNTKNNLIGMWALSPSLFDLYSERLDVVRPSVSVQYPGLQYAILQALYSHSNTHGNFISTSSLLTQSSPNESSLFASVSPSTSSNFSRLLKVLADLLRHSSTSFDCKLLAVRWVTELVVSLHSSPQVFTTHQFLSLVQALYTVGYDQEEDVASAVHICLTNLFQNPRTYPKYIIKGCVKLCMYRLNEGSEILRDNYFSLICLLPVNVTTSKNNGLYLLEEDSQLVYSEGSVGLDALWQVCRSYSTRPPLGSFHSHNFKQVMGYLLQNQKSKVVGSQAWLDAMFQSAQRPSSKQEWKSTDPLVIQNYISQSPTVQWYWATWEAAQFCVLTRLKTPLGKPQETFTSIEAPMSGDCRQRVKLVLQFMEQLERHLYNAYEGAAVSMPNLPKAVRTFFRTNKNTCLEWLSRIRMYVIVMALHAGMYTSVVRHASILMLELKDAENVQVSDEICIHYLVQALCLLGEADSVQGVYEVAAKEYRTVIQGLLQTEEDRDETVKSDETGKSDEAPTVPSKITGILGRPSLGPGAALGTRINMFANEVLNCYVQLEDWGSALEWQESAMSSFDHEEMGEARQHLDLVMGDGADWGLTCGVQGALCKLVRASTTAHQHAVNNHKSEIMKELTETMDVCEGILKTQCTEWPILASPDVLSMLTMAATLQDHIDNKSVCLLPLSDNLQVDETDHNVSTFLQAIRLVKLQQAISGGVPPVKELSEQLKKLQLSTSSLARKQHNYSLAKSVLNKHAAILLEGRSEVMKGHDLDTLKVSLKELHEVNGASMVDVLRLQREAAKLIHSTGDHRESVELLSGSVVGYVCSEKVRSAVCSKLAARSLLTLVKWLQVDYKLLSSVALGVGQGDGASSLAHNMDDLLMIEERTAASNMRLINQEGTDVKIGDNPILMDTDRIVGRLLHLSTIQCESLPKSWYAFAGWCYKWGRKAVDSASQYDDGTETRRQLIVACEALQTPMGEISLEALLEVWRGVVRRIYHYYQLSASSYFKFLKLNGGTNPLKEQNTEDCNVISTLRVLRLLVKHAWELRAVLEDGLAATPTAPWKGIIPQLFSRLSHPEAYVRQSISDLLCRLAEDAPHLIVYPAVVGSSTSRLDAKTESGLLNNYLAKDGDVDGATEGNSQEEEEIPVETEAESLLHNCILSMLNTLATNFPQMIGDVKQLIKELRRITLLWDELWLGSLNQQHGDVERRISQLETEIKKVNNNSALSKEERTAIIREKHRAVLKPTVYLMERLCEITSQPPETPHETWFQDTYGQLITNALNRLKNPPNPSHPRASWHPFKQIHVSLQQKAQKRNSLMLSMQEISPKLHALRNTVIAMPGLGTAGQIVTIESVSNVVQILPTKTKPKKLVFKGSDGKRYPYLFKGLEDLHLDERIMQFLNIVNNMFAADNKGSHEVFRARHYSVTPLGPRSGLIQWVDGATPLFALYKRWQQREALVQLLKQQASGGASAAQQPSIPRPSEVYYNKLAPLLKEKGIKDLENRKDWPLSVQRKALEELMAETPRDLLARELWCSSNGPNEWWYVTQTFARSTAVMSMIGYIIGLGDRHLDNVLVDLATGEVLHIDYNVCFEKGNSLRVPERVHFRLTQNVEAALGITGIEGTFRLASEHVMKTLRKGRETLLTLLEAFVYDPLVDWTTGNEGGFAGAFYGGGLAPGVGEGRQGKADMEREITSSMFSIRVAEMKVPWIQNRYKEYVVLKANRDGVNTLVQEKIKECRDWHLMHKHVMNQVQGSAFQKMCNDIASSLSLGTPSFAAAKEFLQGAGQGSVVQQCEQVESELTGHLQLQRTNLTRVIDVLHTYATIVAQFGQSFANNTRTSNYLTWLQELTTDFTEDKCLQIVQHCADLYGDGLFSPARVQLVLAADVRLQTIIQDTNTKLIKLLERRSLEKAEIRLLEQHVIDSRGAIDNFVRGAGDRLMDLTSRDGDWFLEELCSMSGNGEEGSQLSLMYRGLAVTNHVYTALQDLNVNFRNIILPEALKIIQSEDDSVYGVVSGLEGILADHGGSVGDRGLDTLIAQLEVLHRNAVMGMKNENLELLQRVSSMEAQFKSLLESGMSGSPQELTPGQMLLMGFNGLFTRLEDEFSTLLECIDGLQVPTVWKKVDVIKEAKSLQEFFHMCTQFAAAILGMEGGNCVDDEQFTRPIKRYIADYVRKQIIGFPSQLLGYIVCVLMEGMGLDVRAEIELKDIGAECKAPLEDLCKKAVDGGLRQGLFQQHHFTQASTLTSALDATWRRHDLTRRLDSNLELLKGSFQRAQLHLTRLHWVQEDVFIQAGIQPSHLMVASRATVMSEIKKCMQSVLGEEASLSHVQSQYSQLEGSITQRLKWAAGANPSLNLILQQFEDASLVRKQLAEEETKISQEVVRLCQGILHLEALRTRTAEAMSSDSNFLTLIQKCNESCRLTGQSSCSVTEQEVTLVQIMPLGEGQRTDTGWMKAALSEVNTQLQDADKKMLALKNSIDDAREGIKTEVNAIRTLLASHHKLMSDIRAILKSLAKQEETEQGDHVSEGSVRQYLNTYKKFSENLTMALKMIVSEEFTAETMAETKALLESLATQIPQIYDELVALAPPLVSASEEPRNGSPVSFATAVKKSSAAGVEEGRRAIPPDLTGTPPTSSPLTTAKPHVSTPVKKAEKISRDPKTGKAIQERNSYAVGVWRRVKMKLDGRDPDQNKRLSVAEQKEKKKKSENEIVFIFFDFLYNAFDDIYEMFLNNFMI
ncbi:SMG1-like protein [Mya arenaria]|uniref:non-specific serine/threonine protein kinase n=1 Tax=Mya arenaria TaxID=6604 RepID=A0ABY7DMU5_MYAAR|nr:SMG1-like protein [Mya arenaria]